MGKHGPCYHCGVTSTPLWRNGPPEKPVLCNACGSRWRTKGTLANYTPLHARAESGDLDDHSGSRVKNMPTKTSEAKFLKRKHVYDYNEAEVTPDYCQFLPKCLNEDTSNGSSSGSAISNSESCAQFTTTQLSDLPGPTQPNIYDAMMPSKRKTCAGRPKPSPVEQLTEDLCTILHEQQCSYTSGSSEEDLLYESDKPMVSVEIGHGSVLIRHPSSIGREENPEARSLLAVDKQNPLNEVPSPGTNPLAHTHEKGQEMGKRDKDGLEKLQMLGHHISSLGHISLKDVKIKKNCSGFEVAGVPDDVSIGNFVNVTRSLDGVHQSYFSVPETITKSPERLVNMGNYENKDGDNSCFITPKCLFELPSPSNSFYVPDCSDQDLLLDVPSNCFFPQAELLLPS
ncbi:unnamed protein product [Cuscuta epithymum]|uniref:GATA-type domain-containing protein n=1 Tax=Cuscuta epithymum TaxID=186058 RepID=A0AAV0FF17_9ASTE|nr:unnamed protein product [Cuscuta epithymum]